MGFYSDDIIEDVRSSNDIVDLISSYVTLKRSGERYLGLCPFHNEKTPSFSVSKSKQMYYCFGCGAGGNAYTFMMQYENMSFPEAVEDLAKRAGIALPKSPQSPEQRKRQESRDILLKIQKKAAEYYRGMLLAPDGEPARNYLKERGIRDDTSRGFGLGYSGRGGDGLYRTLRAAGYEDRLIKGSGLVIFDERGGAKDRFRDRLIFPIADVRGRVIGFGGRIIGRGEPKYLNSPETEIFDKSRVLYGLNYAKRSGNRGIILCEGYMDVIALYQAGFSNAAASLGTAFTPGHAGVLKRYTDEVYLSFDSDDAGVRAALRAIPICREAGLRVRVIGMDPHKDPDEFISALGREEYQRRISDAENAFIYSVRMGEREHDLDDPAGKTAFFRTVAGRLLEFSEELERESYLEAIAQRYRIPERQLRSMVESEEMRSGAAGAAERQMRERVSGRNREKSKEEDAVIQAQRLLLSWLCEAPALFDATKIYLDPDDFVGEPYARAAAAIYLQHAKGDINPARIVDIYEDEKTQREVAAIFNSQVKRPQSAAEKEKFLKELIHRVKKYALEMQRSREEPGDLSGQQHYLDEIKKLNAFEKSKIDLSEC